MAAKRVFQSIIVVAVLAASLASTGTAFAWSGCSGYVTVNWGDSLSGMAAACGTTVDAIRAANPGMGWQLYAGQVIYMPTGYSSAGYYPPQSGGSTYVVRWGDALGDIAVRYGVSLASLLAVNPQIWNPSLIFPGQVINLPAFGNYQPPNNYPPTYYPPSSYPPTYYPPTSYPPPPVTTGFSVLKVTFGHGLLVRTGPGKNFSEIKSPLVSAVKNTTWWYRKSSITVDSTGLVWAEVMLSQPVNGYSTGWVMVKDMFGNYFTDPNINP